jgi:hypothetical protein
MKQGKKPTRDEKILLSKVNLDWSEYQTIGTKDEIISFISKKDNSIIRVRNTRKPKIVTE